MNGKTLIAIPTFNAEVFLERTLKSTLLSGNNATVYVVDNCSEDTTQQIATQFSREHTYVNYIRNQRNIGRVANWNRCIELALESDCQYLKFLFAGDELLESSIEKMKAVLDSNQNIGVISSAYIIRDTGGSEKTKQQMDKSQTLNPFDALLRSALSGAWWASPTIYMINKRHIADIRFAEEFPWAADWKFTIDIAAGSDSYWLDDSLSVFNMDSRRNYLASGQKLESQLENCLMQFYSLSKIKDELGNEQYQKYYNQIRESFLTRLVRAKEIPAIVWRKFISRIQ